ncbi:putative bicarbonate transporter, IctB family [compost metagenome]
MCFIALATLSIIGAKNHSLGINAIAEILVVLSMMINLSVLLYKRLHLFSALCFMLGLSTFFQSLQALNDFKGIMTGHSIFEASEFIIYVEGNTGNINIFSMSLMAKLPFLFIGIMHFTNWKRWLLMTALVMSSFLVYLISARASLLALLIIVIVFVAFYLRQNGFKFKNAIKLMYLFIPLLISFGVVNYIFSKNQDGRYTNTVERFQQIKIGESSANVRLDYYRAAIDLTLENPVLGIGLDGWRVESLPRETLNNGIASLHTHNDFLQLFAETGVFGGLFYLSIFVALLFIHLKRLAKPQEDQAANVSILAFMVLLVYGIDATFNFPFYRPTMQLFFCLMMALTLVRTNVIAETVATKFKKSHLALTLIILAATPLYYTYQADRTSQLEYQILADNINFNNKGKLTGDEVANFGPLIPNVLTTSESFDEYNGIYYFREKKYDKAIQYLDRGNQVNPYLGRPDFYKYLIAEERDMADSAAIYAIASFNRYPVNPVLFNAAVKYPNKVDTNEVLKMYQRSAAYGNHAKIWAMAVTALQARKYSRANLARFLESGVRDFPKNAMVKATYQNTLISDYIIAGQELFAKGKHERALQLYEKALAIDSTDVFALQKIGFYYFNLQQSAKAIPYLKKALEKDGLTGGKTEYFLALCYLNVNDQVNACKYLVLAHEIAYPAAETMFLQHCR